MRLGMANYKQIYQHEPALYDELVCAEDVDGNLRQALLKLCSVRGSTVVEAGAGTGRLTRLMLEEGAAHVIATELEAAMLALAARSLEGFGDSLQCIVADARQLPVADNTADIAIAGWVFGHFRAWSADGWREEIGAALSHLERVTCAGGTVVVIETLGTGSEHPSPTPELQEYYQWLETQRGYVRTSIRSDYLFA